MSAADRKCPVPECEVKVPAGRLLCQKHWWRASLQTRKDVNRTWKTLQRSAFRDEYAMTEYRLACEAAIESARRN
jgi:hypothetical protein